MPRLAPVPLDRRLGADDAVRQGDARGGDRPARPTAERRRGTAAVRSSCSRSATTPSRRSTAINQAAFSVRLDQEGVTILEHALQGEMSPIGVVYSLQYVGLRPGLQRPGRRRLGPRPDAHRGEREGRRAADRLAADRQGRRRARRGTDHHDRVATSSSPTATTRAAPPAATRQPSTRFASWSSRTSSSPAWSRCSARDRRLDRRLRTRPAHDRDRRGDDVLGEQEGRPHAHRPQDS